jgi:hypothetical protein
MEAAEAATVLVVVAVVVVENHVSSPMVYQLM